MSRTGVFSNPFLLGFDQIERTLDRLARNGHDGYPPYNIEQTGEHDYAITLAVAGVAPAHLWVTVEDNHLQIKGRQADEKQRAFLHRGIAARPFQRSFVLADAIEVVGANVANGLLCISLKRRVEAPKVRRVTITSDPKPVSPNMGPKNAGPKDAGTENAKRHPL